VALGAPYDSSAGAPFPLMSTTGEIDGLCLPTGADPCFDLSGASATPPATMASVITATSGWNGPALVLGPRVYIPDGNTDQVECFDYSTAASCANFPFQPSNLGLLYTVTADWQRPTCIWVNSDNGSAQIQNFDAYTAGGCGQGPIRVLASSFVVPTQLCIPTTYTSLQVLSPPPASYTSGTVTFEDADGNPIPGTIVEPLDATGTVSLTGLNLNTALGLPEFLITLTGSSGTPTSVEVQLTWTGVNDPSCVPGGHPTTPNVVFVHGINGNFVGLQNAAIGNDPSDKNWIELLQPLASKSNLSIFAYYQDAGYSDAAPSTPNVDCALVAPPPVTDPHKYLYVDPTASPYLGTVSSSFCDSQSALAFDAQALDGLVKLSKSNVVVANSMGGAITRGWLAYAQHNDPTDTSPEMTNLKDVVFLQGAQQGSWIAAGGAALQNAFGSVSQIPILDGLAQNLENYLVQKIGFDPRRPGVVDLAPVSKWYKSVNPDPFPVKVNYFNVATDEVAVANTCVLFLCWDAGQLDLGDLVLLPGQNTTKALPSSGGSLFLPKPQSGFARYQDVIGRAYTFSLLDVLGDLSAVTTLAGDSATHFNFGSHVNEASAFTVQSCNSTQQETVTNLVLQVVQNQC
jgi:pimeloyl-ACP methyl ester carboxylesterase